MILIWICLVIADGMGTAEWRAAKSPSYYKRGDYVPGLKVSLFHFFSIGALNFASYWLLVLLMLLLPFFFFLLVLDVGFS